MDDVDVHTVRIESQGSGLSYVKSAKEAGLTMNHSSVKNLLYNERYLGDDFYPAIIDQEMYEAVEVERLRRLEESHLRQYLKNPYKHTVDVRPIQTEFVLTTQSLNEKNMNPSQCMTTGAMWSLSRGL